MKDSQADFPEKAVLSRDLRERKDITLFWRRNFMRRRESKYKGLEEKP